RCGAARRWCGPFAFSGERPGSRSGSRADLLLPRQLGLSAGLLRKSVRSGRVAARRAGPPPCPCPPDFGYDMLVLLLLTSSTSSQKAPLPLIVSSAFLTAMPGVIVHIWSLSLSLPWLSLPPSSPPPGP